MDDLNDIKKSAETIRVTAKSIEGEVEILRTTLAPRILWGIDLLVKLAVLNAILLAFILLSNLLGDL